MRALWPCDELWIAQAVPRLERTTERKADGSVVGNAPDPLASSQVLNLRESGLFSSYWRASSIQQSECGLQRLVVTNPDDSESGASGCSPIKRNRSRSSTPRPRAKSTIALAASRLGQDGPQTRSTRRAPCRDRPWRSPGEARARWGPLPRTTRAPRQVTVDAAGVGPAAGSGGTVYSVTQAATPRQRP